ncbi:hypothetical protein G5I_10012 [Acromyrmex echinatior]|uniref:Uncharacterized protein n=1 Tax=Acromyrmex echinatior TaxID=103372 RepID=F4WVR2_ACREC|nr:hypothetical protein G5I_10012 [Acromyrmex echinatior]
MRSQNFNLGSSNKEDHFASVCFKKVSSLLHLPEEESKREGETLRIRYRPRAFVYRTLALDEGEMKKGSGMTVRAFQDFRDKLHGIVEFTKRNDIC